MKNALSYELAAHSGPGYQKSWSNCTCNVLSKLKMADSIWPTDRLKMKKFLCKSVLRGFLVAKIEFDVFSNSK